MFKLVIQDDEGKTTVVPLIRDEITIGRKEGNTIRLTERNVSRRHARIVRNNGEVQIEDLGSYNGIRVNNARIAERVSLRVSDQVQIGDYKLYLKAEGVEQVDEARTMPIERVDGAATDVIPAVAPAPTQPVPVQSVAGATTPTPPPGQVPGVQIVGANPNRTMVAVADTGEDGRPLARPEHIAAAIPQTAGYGKLVVVSSNFAGKEFELSRPQMIVGRTDENDIVINHRSISRNHAKLVREPDTGRYTISDLQSSNGVRVNGNDYGKVELRRGDVVDLGHVRLRFIEPGEDFVFSRDAVITDVPETGGSKKGMVIGLLFVLVVGAVIVAFVLKGGGGDKESGGGVGTASGGNLAVNPTEDAGASVPPLIDAAEVNATEDAAGPDVTAIATRCAELKDKKAWTELQQCGHDLDAAGDSHGKELIERATSESKAEVALRKLTEDLKKGDFKDATEKLKDIPDDSIYRSEASDQYKQGLDTLVRTALPQLRAYARKHDCRGGYQQQLNQLEHAYGRIAADKARDKVKCTPREPVAANPCANCSSGTHCENNHCVKNTPPPDPCAGAGAIEAAADADNTAGRYAQALVGYEKIMRCKNVKQKAYLVACKSRNFAKAKIYFKGLPLSYAQICLNQGFDPRKVSP